MPELEKKLRLQLYDKEMNQISDRLIGQNLELISGPKEIHKGPLKIEVCLFTQEDIEKFILYLKKLTGNIPLTEKIKKIKNLKIEINEDREKIISELIKTTFTQDDLINALRTRGFKFLTPDYIEDLELSFKIKEGDEKFQFMMRPLKEAKNPQNNKFDPSLAFGFKLIGDKISKFNVYLFGGKEIKAYEKKWKKDSNFTFKSTDMIKFPQYMIAEERIKWRKEHFDLLRDPKKTPSKNYLRWKDDVVVGGKK